MVEMDIRKENYNQKASKFRLNGFLNLKKKNIRNNLGKIKTERSGTMPIYKEDSLEETKKKYHKRQDNYFTVLEKGNKPFNQICQSFDHSEIRKVEESRDSGIKIPEINIIKSPTNRKLGRNRDPNCNRAMSSLSPSLKMSKSPQSRINSEMGGKGSEGFLDRKLNSYFSFREKYKDQIKDLSMKEQFDLLDYIRREQQRAEDNESNVLDFNSYRSPRRQKGEKGYDHDEYNLNFMNKQEDLYSFNGKNHSNYGVPGRRVNTVDSDFERIEILSESKRMVSSSRKRPKKTTGTFREIMLRKIKAKDSDLADEFHYKLINNITQ